MAPRKPGYTGGYDRARKRMLATMPLCAHCQQRPATRADHQPPLALHHHVDGTGCCRLVPSCIECERLQSGLLGGDLRPLPPPPLVEPDGFGVDDPVWDKSWLDELREVPDNATWPRLMTVPHPRAVASLGAKVADWAHERRRRPWRWWQRLATTRLLEIDAQGVLVWDTLLLTLARQLGKTWWLHDLCSWRLEQGERFGAEQTVVSTGKDLAVVREMQRPARVRAKGLSESYRVREVNGQEEVEWLADSSRWMIRSKDGVYGLSASMATVDEAWKVSASAVDDGIVPTQVEQPQAQLVLTSTAHRRATALVIGRRASALDRLADPGEDGLLLLEWSAPRNMAPEDREGWRLASPHWTPRRERLVALRLEAARAGESDDVDEPDPMESFRTQWLNQWPAKRLAGEKGEQLVDAEQWARSFCGTDSEGSLVVGVEDTAGQGAAVGFCGVLPDGRWVLGGVLRASRAAAYELAREALDVRPGSTLVVGASLHAEAETLDFVEPVCRAGSRETGPALTLLRELLNTGQVTQDGSVELADQVDEARVTTGVHGLSLVAGPRSDLLRATVWALWVAVTQPAMVPAIH